MAYKQPEERRRRSGYVREDQRHTQKLTLRMSPEDVALARELADSRGMQLVQLVAAAIRAFKDAG